MMDEEVNVSQVQEPITTASPEIYQIIERVLALEKSKLYQRSPRNINDDIVQIIKDIKTLMFGFEIIKIIVRAPMVIKKFILSPVRKINIIINAANKPK